MLKRKHVWLQVMAVWMSVLFPVSTWATSNPTVLVHHVDMPTQGNFDYEAVKRAVYQAFAQSDQVRVVSQKEISRFMEKNLQGSVPDTKDDDYLVLARELLKEGTRAYQELEFQEAVSKLSESRDEWLRNLAHVRNNQELLKAHLFLAMSFMGLYKQAPDRIFYKQQAQKEFEKIVYLDADFTMSQRQYSPEVIQTFEEVKQEILQRPRVTLKVRANEPNARVFINGKREGSAPLSLQLIPGTYYVLVESKKDFTLPFTNLVELKRPVEEIHAEIASFVDVQKEQNLYRIREGGAQRLEDVSFVQNRAKAMDADMVFLATIEDVDGYRMLGQLFDARTGEFSQVAFIPLNRQLSDVQGASYDLSQALLDQIRPDGYLVNSRVGDSAASQQNIANAKQAQKEQPSQKTNLLTKWWFWAGIVAVGVGGYLLIDAQSGGSNTIEINNAGNF